VYVIEAQSLFVPALLEVLDELGLELRSVSSDVDMEALLEEQPDVVFVDLDFVDREPLRLLRGLRTLLPNTLIWVYCSERDPAWIRAYIQAGASSVFGKNDARNQILARMHAELHGLGRSSYEA
jgi:DNA-binding NarL/FixJ family response regulator